MLIYHIISKCGTLYMMKIYFLIILIFIPLALSFSSVEEESVNLSKEYSSGNYLIYDCDNKYYVCVDKQGQDYCQKMKDYSLDSFRAFLICAPIKEYPTSAECKIEQKKLIERIAPTKVLCKHPRLLEKKAK